MVFLSNATHAPVPHIDTDLFQLFGHPWATIAAQAQTRLFPDMRQNNHVHALPAAGGTAPPSPQATRADIHDLAQSVDREGLAPFFDEPKPHGVGHSLGPMAFMPSMAREELGGFFQDIPLAAGKQSPGLFPDPGKS